MAIKENFILCDVLMSECSDAKYFVYYMCTCFRIAIIHFSFHVYFKTYSGCYTKLNTACFVIQMIQAIMSFETLRMVYFAYIHSIISYGVIFGGNQPYSDKIFKVQKRVIRIITSSRTRDSCRELFKKN